MPAKALLLYVLAEFKREQELENRANYDSMMLYMIAQPTRKNPERLPVYKPLYEDGGVREAKKGMSGEEILMGLIGNGEQIR